MARPCAAVNRRATASVVQNQIGNDARGNRNQQEIAIVTAHPMVATWWCAQTIAPPVGHDVSRTVFHRQVATAPVPALMPTPIVPVGIAIAIMATIFMVPVVPVTTVTTVTIIVTTVMVAMIVTPAVIMIVTIGLRQQRCAEDHHGATYRQRAKSLFHDRYSLSMVSR